MRAPPPRLSANRFDADLQRARFAIVRLDRGPTPTLMRGLTEYFDAAYPGLFTYGGLPRGTLAPTWFAQHFQSPLGPLRGAIGDGYYLFDSGYVVGHHGGQGGAVGHGDERRNAAGRERVRELAFGFNRVSDDDLSDLHRLVAYFEDIVARKLGGDGFSDSSWTAPPPPPPYSAPPPRAEPRPPPPPPAEDDPYVVLGVPRTATDEEVRAAWRDQMKMNHPDRVSHMSPALQKFALAQTIAIQVAYDAIQKARAK